MVRTADGWTQGQSARQVRQAEAQGRGEQTPVERTAKFRRDRAVVQAAVLEARIGRKGAVVLDRRRRRRLSGKDETP